MKKILVVTHADMNTSAGNVTLMLRRAETLFRLYGYFTEIVVYRGVSKKKTSFVDEFYSVKYVETKKELYDSIFQSKPIYIIIYGARLGVLCSQIHSFTKTKHINCKVLLDVQSCIEEKFEYGKSIKSKISYPASWFLFRLAISNVDGAFVVSDELQENCKKKLLWPHKLDFYKIRCGVTNVMTFDEIMEKRKVSRSEFSINENAVVFVYSGYRMAWQKVDEIILDFMKYDRLIKNAYFVFFCNNDKNFEEKLIKSFPNQNFCVKLLNKENYEKALCACDVGYILRDYKETNRVAFPNKFSDYLSAGLLIAMNKALPEPMRVLSDNDLPYIDTDIDISENINTINDFLKNREAYIKSALQVCYSELLYESQFKNIHFE